MLLIHNIPFKSVSLGNIISKHLPCKFLWIFTIPIQLLFSPQCDLIYVCGLGSILKSNICQSSSPSIITSLYLVLPLILSFIVSVCLSCRPFSRFLFSACHKVHFHLWFLFALCGMLDSCSVFVIISLTEKVMQGLLPPLLCHGDMGGIYLRNSSSFFNARIEAPPPLYFHLCLLSSRVVYSSPFYPHMFCSCFAFTVNLATSPLLPVLAEWGAECWHWVLSKYVVYRAGRW